MLVTSSTELGAAIRERRRALQWTQTDLAGSIGVSKRWVVMVEQGKPTAEVQLVLRAVGALGLRLDISASPAVHDGIDLAALIERHRDG
jgi:HTH-type transcriptional regulator / antitoxin HipB